MRSLSESDERRMIMSADGWLKGNSAAPLDGEVLAGDKSSPRVWVMMRV